MIQQNPLQSIYPKETNEFEEMMIFFHLFRERAVLEYSGAERGLGSGRRCKS